MINKVLLVGRLTKELELRSTPLGKSVLDFTVACSRRFADKTGTKNTDFISCVAWQQSAEYLSKYANKGDLISVEGWIETSSYEKDQRRVYTTKVICDNVQIISSKKNDNQSYTTNDTYQKMNINSNNDSIDEVDEIEIDETITRADLPF